MVLLNYRHLLTVTLALLVVLSNAFAVRGDTPTESKVKAAFLYNFAKFITWPPGAYPASGHPFTFCTTGDNPLDGTLDEVLQGKEIDGHPAVARRVRSVGVANGCQIVFASEPKSSSTVTFPANLETPGLLTVTEVRNLNDLPQHGAMITFVLQANRVRFVIDAKAAERAGLVISSKLLSLALAVNR